MMKKNLTRSKYYHKGPRIDLIRAFGNIRKYKTLFPEVQDSFTGSTRLLEIHFLPGIFDGFHWSTLMTKYDQKQKFFACECTVHQSIFLQYKH